MLRADRAASEDPAVPLTRRRFVAALGALALTAPRALHAQQLKVVGYLANQSKPSATFNAFVAALESRGWVRDKTYELRVRSSDGQEKEFDRLAAELVQAKVDVIVTTGSASTHAAKRATTTIPIVFGSAANPVEQGLVTGLARPGGNITGFAMFLEEVAAKRLQLLKEMLPGASRVARFHSAGNIVALQPAIRRRYDDAARELGITLQHLSLAEAEVPAAFAKARAEKLHAVIIEADPIFMKSHASIARLALENRLPVMSADVRYVNAGCLIGYSEDLVAQYARAASYVDRILKGARPGELPVEQPSVVLRVNAVTAKALGLKIPHSIRVQADAVIGE